MNIHYFIFVHELADALGIKFIIAADKNVFERWFVHIFVIVIKITLRLYIYLEAVCMILKIDRGVTRIRTC